MLVHTGPMDVTVFVTIRSAGLCRNTQEDVPSCTERGSHGRQHNVLTVSDLLVRRVPVRNAEVGSLSLQPSRFAMPRRFSPIDVGSS